MHNLAVLVMLNFLPVAKHFHVITSLPNVFFKKLEPLGQLSKPEYDENTVRYGTSRIDHFTWKQVLDMFSCTECGRCSSQCPATATGKPLAPRQLLLDLRDYLYKHQDEVDREARRRAARTAPGGTELPEVGENIVGPVIEDEVLWSCNMCRACEESCPVMIEYVDKIVDMRRHLVQEEARFPEELTRVFKGMETQSNPWGVGRRQALRVGRRARHPHRRRQARRRVPLLRRLRRRLRRSQQEDHAGVRAAAQEGGRRLRLPGAGGALQRRLGAPARQRVPLPGDGADGGRDLQRLQREEGHRELPALLQHDQERVHPVRRHLRGDPRRRPGEAADRVAAGSR